MSKMPKYTSHEQGALEIKIPHALFDFCDTTVYLVVHIGIYLGLDVSRSIDLPHWENHWAVVCFCLSLVSSNKSFHGQTDWLGIKVLMPPEVLAYNN